MKATQTIIDAIEKEGITHVFMVPGGIVDSFTKELAESRTMTTVVSAHEGGALAMADGYARASGKFGVAMCIAGPGIMNMVTGIYTAYMDRSPVLIVSGEVPTLWEGRGGFQDTSPHGMVHDGELLKSVTRMTCSIENMTNFGFYIRTLFKKMLGASSRGPVHFGIPADVQNMETSYEHIPISPRLSRARVLDTAACHEIPTIIANSRRIAIICGSGAYDLQTSSALLEFAEKYRIPVITTFAAKGTFPEDHPLSLGYIGWSGSRSALDTVFSSDLETLIVLGSRLNMQDTLFWNNHFSELKALIQVDLDENSIGQHFVTHYPVVGDCLAFLRHIDRKLQKLGMLLADTLPLREEWLTELATHGSKNFMDETQFSEMVPLHPARVIAALREIMPRNTTLVVDTGAHGFFASHYWRVYAPRQFISSIRYVGAMGWAIGAGIGAKFAKPEDPCVVVTGDGCMLMHGMEIQTAARHHLDIVFVVINNSALGNPYLRAQKISPTFANLLTLPTHDWAMFARSLGAQGCTINLPGEINQAIQAACKAGGTWVLDFRCGNYPTPTEEFDRSLQRAR